MPVLTTLEQLEAVQTQITTLQAAVASYTLGDLRVTRDKQSLSVLYARERYLLAKYNREQANGRGRIRLNLSGGA